MYNLIKGLYNKKYIEGKNSTTIHNGKVYLVDDIIKAAQDLKLTEVPIKDLEWFLEPPKWLSEDTKLRMNAVTLDYPPIVTEVSEGLVSLDGYHRILKARSLGFEYIEVKILTDLPRPLRHRSYI